MAVMRFKEKPNAFVTCEFDEGHDGEHIALMFKWRKMEDVADYGDWFRGLNEIKMRLDEKVHIK